MAGQSAAKEFLLLSRFDLFEPKLDSVFAQPISEMRVLCIPTAAKAEDDASWLAGEMAPLRTRARHFEEFDLAGRSAADVNAAMADADLIYVTGGNTYYLLEKMQQCHFAQSLNEAFNRGARYIGVSAGAVVACPDIRFIGAMDDASKARLSDFTGLNLIDFPVLPHLDMEEYASAVSRIIEFWPADAGKMLTLRDDQGLSVCGNHLQVF